MTDDAPTFDPAWDRTNPHVPAAIREYDAWMCQEDKMPTGQPWSDAERVRSWNDPANWTDYETAREWADKHPQYESALAFISQTPDDPYREPTDPFLMVDGDDVRDPDTGEVLREFEQLVRDLGATYCDVSRSATGCHAYYEGELPAEYTTGFSMPLTDDDDGPHVDVYHGKRQYIFTGKHVVGTPATIEPVANTELLVELCEIHGSTKGPDDDHEPREIRADPDEAREREWTTDFDDILAVIEDLSVHDMRMKSQHTTTRSNGDEDWDPHIPGEPASESGTRLSIFNRGRGVHYRKGDITGGALQLVAWEEGIVTPGEKLRGDDFLRAVQVARERGARIPKYDAGMVGLPDHDDADAADANDSANDANDDADEPETATDGGRPPRDAIDDPRDTAPDPPATMPSESSSTPPPPPDEEPRFADAESREPDEPRLTGHAYEDMADVMEDASPPVGDATAHDAADGADGDASPDPDPPDDNNDGGGGPGDPNDPGGAPDPDPDPLDIYRRALREISWPAGRIRVVEENGNTFERGIDDVIGQATDLRDAYHLFERNQTELDRGECQELHTFVLWFGGNALGEWFTVERGDAESLHYFHHPDASVYPVEPAGRGGTISDEFRGLVQDVFGIAPGQWSSNLFTGLISHAKRHSPTRGLHRFAAYNADDHELYVNAYDDRYYAATIDGIEERRNGTDVFFETPNRAEPFTYLAPGGRQDLPAQIPGERPMFAGGGDPVMRLLPNRVNFAEDGSALGPMDQRNQLYTHLHVLPFIDMLSERPIMAWIGNAGSGKTAVQRSIGKWLVGGDFRESSMPSDEQDFITKIVNSPLSFVDNFDDGKEWANDILAAVATGTGVEMRELYTTASLIEYDPDCWLSITSRDPPFRRDDVADRLVIFTVERVDTDGDQFVPMGTYYGQIDQYRDTLWSAYLDNLHAIMAQLDTTDLDSIATTHRMSDWARMAHVIADALGIDDMDELLDAAEVEQSTFSLADEPVGIVVDEWVNDDPADAAQWRSASVLMDRLQDKQEEHDTPALDVASPKALGTKLSTTLESPLRELYDLEVDRGGRVNEYRFAVDDADAHATGLGRY